MELWTNFYKEMFSGTSNERTQTLFNGELHVVNWEITIQLFLKFPKLLIYSNTTTPIVNRISFEICISFPKKNYAENKISIEKTVHSLFTIGVHKSAGVDNIPPYPLVLKILDIQLSTRCIFRERFVKIQKK